MSLEIKGLGELQKKLKKMSDGAKELDGEHQIPISDLLTESFLRDHTNFKNAQELFDKSGFKIETPEAFKAIPDKDWDKYIVNVSNFDNWQEMLQAATTNYIKNKMGL